MKYVKQILFALTAAFFCLLPFFYPIYNTETRLTIYWDYGYYASIATAIGTLGGFYFVLYRLAMWVMSKVRRGLRVVDFVVFWVLQVLLFRSCVSILDRSGMMADGPLAMLDQKWLKIIYYILFPSLFLWIGGVRARWIVRKIYAILVPAFLLLMIMPITYTVYKRDIRLPDTQKANLRNRSGATAPNIFILIFDECSYNRLFNAGRIRDDLPNLKELAQTSVVYHQAFSGGVSTKASFPRFLFQNDSRGRQLDYRDAISANYIGKARAYTNIFSEAGESWYEAVAGFEIDYPHLVGHSTDYCVIAFNSQALRSYWKETVWLLQTQISWLRYLTGSDVRIQKDPNIMLCVYSLEQVQKINLYLIEEINPPIYALLHYCLPHEPFVWNRQGWKHYTPGMMRLPTVENYMDNLYYMDTLIGQICRALKASGKWDQTVLIVTSDHAWRGDPDKRMIDAQDEDALPESPFKHVPLIIKYPGGKPAGEVNEPFSLLDLYESVIRQFIVPAADPAPAGQPAP